MKVTATIICDDDRWAKHPWGVKFDDPSCQKRFGYNGLDKEKDCYKIIENARNAGYDVEIKNRIEYY